MYAHNSTPKTSINRNTTYKGERIEEKINRIVNNKEPITDGAPIVYTERKKGVEPQYNIKTDRFEIAVDAMDYVTRSHIAKREERMKDFEKKLDDKNKKLEDKNKTQGKENGGAEPVGGTGNQ